MSFQPDIASSIERGQLIPFNVVQNILTARLSPAKLRQTPYHLSFPRDSAHFDKPYLVVPSNQNRMSLTFGFSGTAGFAADIWLSFGYPSKQKLFGAVNAFGLPYVAGTGAFGVSSENVPFSFIGGNISVDDVYITAGPNADIDTEIVIYEGVLAVESRENIAA